MDTISTTISNALYCLVENPEYQDRLYEELTTLYPDKELGYGRKESPLLGAVLSESQRMYPIINLLFRKATNPMRIKNLSVKAGDIIGIDIFSLQNSPEYWEDAHLFKPERFLEAGVQASHNDVYLPFGCGPRTCIAARMATVQCHFVLAKIILTYRIRRTKRTELKFAKIPHQLVYPSLVIDFQKRNN